MERDSEGPFRSTAAARETGETGAVCGVRGNVARRSSFLAWRSGQLTLDASQDATKVRAVHAGLARGLRRVAACPLHELAHVLVFEELEGAALGFGIRKITKLGGHPRALRGRD